MSNFLYVVSDCSTCVLALNNNTLDHIPCKVDYYFRSTIKEQTILNYV
jgi:hypothetical protein